MADRQPSALEAKLAEMDRPVPVKSAEEHARDFIRMAARQITALRDDRQFAGRCFGYRSLSKAKRYEVLSMRLARTYRRRAAELLAGASVSAAQAKASGQRVAA
jgi:hypothetical protein